MIEIGSGVCGTPANFNSLLHRRRSPKANQTLHNVWPSPGLVYYIYIYIYTFSFQGLLPWQNFAQCKIHFTSKSCICLYWQHYCTALQQRASAKLCGVIQGMEFRNFRIWRPLYLAGQPSRWGSAHFLVTPYIPRNILWDGIRGYEKFGLFQQIAKVCEQTMKSKVVTS